MSENTMEEISYQTLYLLQHEWERLYPSHDLFKQEIKKLEIDPYASIQFNSPMWIKKNHLTEKYYTHPLHIETGFFSKIFAQSILFSLKEANELQAQL